MDLDKANQLINNIIKICDKKTDKTVDFKKMAIEKIAHKYSNSKLLIYRIYIDFGSGKELISRNNPYRVHYKCTECSRINIVNLNNIIRKMNRNITKCNMCKNLDEDKRLTHSNFLKNGKQSCKKDKIVLSIKEKIEYSECQFYLMDDDYKDDYFNKHLTLSEYNIIKPKIISIQNDKFTCMDNFTYVPHLKIGNQTMYNPYFYDIERDVLEKPIYIKFMCESCGSPYITKHLFNFKNKYKMLCKDCTFCNKTFKIRTYKNIENDRITYQSKFELKFIKKCNEENILLENGPRINYMWNNKPRIYVVDFYIPCLDMLIEIKDNHIWHKQQLQNGKWNAKIKSVENNIKNNKYKKFLLIHKENYMESICNITRKIKNNNTK
tara:strand:+ start:241 stop:1380 length:1140 start_codon:yes stop_codon:yes gene_type:complete